MAYTPTRNPQSMEDGSGLAVCMTLEETNGLTSDEAVGPADPRSKAHASLWTSLLG